MKYLILLLLAISATGCQAVQQSARDVGNPVGQVIAVPQSITEGAAEGFVGERDANPYGR